MLAGELTEGVGSAHLSMFACSLVQGKVGEGGGGEMPVSCYLWIPPKPRLQQSALFRSGYQHLSWGAAERGEINKKKANSSDRRMLFRFQSK